MGNCFLKSDLQVWPEKNYFKPGRIKFHVHKFEHVLFISKYHFSWLFQVQIINFYFLRQTKTSTTCRFLSVSSARAALRVKIYCVLQPRQKVERMGRLCKMNIPVSRVLKRFSKG